MSDTGPTNPGRISDPTVSVGDESYCPSCDESFDISVSSCPNDGSKLVAFTEEPDDLIGEVLDDRFLIDAKIGAGGMGTVYKARQSSIGRDVAVKVIHPSRTRNRAASKRFLREARLASKLTHPNTVVVHDVGQAGSGALYIAMELVAGVTLRERIREAGEMAIDEVVNIASQLCDALAAAHKLGIIHRDLKPSNVMLVDGVVKVLDFGLAKSLAGDASTTELTDSNQIMGTPAYISPEMVRGESLDERSDLYSLGCVIYEMIAGEAPFLAPNTSAVLARHLEDTAPRLEAPAAIAELVAALLAKEPARRPPSAAAVKAALQSAPAAEVDPTELAPVRRWPLLVSAGLMVAVVAVVAVGAASRYQGSKDEPVATVIPIDAEPDVTIPPAPIDAPYERLPVFLTVEGLPPRAKVKLPTGEPFAVLDRIEFDLGDEPINLRFTAPGHHAQTLAVTPDGDKTIEVKLRPRRRGRPATDSGSGDSKPPEVPFKVD